MAITDIPRLDAAQVNTRYNELRTLAFGSFRFRTMGEVGHGVEAIEVPETGQSFSSGQPEAAKEVEVEFYMADADVLGRFREWVRFSRLRLPGYLQPCTVAYLRDSGDPSDVIEMAIPEVWAKSYTGPAANQAEPALGKVTGRLMMSGAELPLFV